MIENLRLRTFGIVAFFLFCVLYLLPNAVKLPEGWWFHKKPLSYGLDIQGGAHLVYGVDVDGVMAERHERTARALEAELKDRGIATQSVGVSEKKDLIVIEAKSDADREKAAKYIGEDYATTLQLIGNAGTRIEARFFDAVLETHRTNIIDQAIQVIRNRVDEFGVAEPVIAAQGRDRILVQLPGVSDPAQAKELINKTARLEFRMVVEDVSGEQLNTWITDAEKAGSFALGKDRLTYRQYIKKLNEALKGKLPPNTMVAFERARQAKTMEAGKVAYLVRTDTDLSGDLLEDAFLGQDEMGKPTVNFRFGTDGRRKFSDLTGNNVGKLMAIVLDDVIYSAPQIRERIDGQGQISLGAGTYDEAIREGQLISTALRAGALPAALQQMEERSVGPSLGADSIDKGKKAGAIGVVLVVIFMIAYYKLSGLVAGITLVLNVVGLLAILSALGATLTLPGIAGITLTVGMAVDANVIIFERIREELRRGLSMAEAIRLGFDKAWSAIFDSNVTTAIAAAVLIYFGSGPVRGFGVTLIAGIVTTVVTAVFVSHYLMDVLTAMSKNKKISI